MMHIEALLWGEPFTNSFATEPIDYGPYASPKSFSMSGQRGIDRFGKADNSKRVKNTDYLSTTGVTGGAPDQCATCGGSGILDEHTCPECKGTGIIRNFVEDYKASPEVESAYESGRRSGAKGLENDGKPVDKKDFMSPKDGPQVGKFEYPRGKTTKTAQDFPQHTTVKNEWNGKLWWEE